MLRRVWILATLAVLGTMGAGCTVETDLGTQCSLVKKNPNPAEGERDWEPITEKEITAGKDFISFGASECEDLVCVLDADHIVLTGNDDAPVMGYCSRPCVPGSATGCPQAEAALDADPATAMTCRTMMLDAATMARICQADPQKCEQYFGGTTSPYFCGRGGEQPAE